MPLISEKDLFNFNIPEPLGLSDLLWKLESPSSKRQLIKEWRVKLNRDDPPILIYIESRGKDNWLHSVSWYGGNGSDGMIFHMGAREALTINSKYLSTSVRGSILDYFCRIEFCLDALICIAEGAFDGGREFSEIKKDLYESGGVLSSTEQKISYLQHHEMRYLSRRTADLLRKAKNIRNVMSHQFLVQNNLGLTSVDLKRYPEPLHAIELIFTATWIAILNDYNKHQIHVAEWLLRKAESSS